MPINGIARQVVGDIGQSKTRGEAYRKELDKLMPEQLSKVEPKTQPIKH
jgi:hypothetical protein